MSGNMKTWIKIIFNTQRIQEKSEKSGILIKNIATFLYKIFICATLYSFVYFSIKFN